MPDQATIDFWAQKVRFHRAMAVACVGNPERSDEHARKMHEAVERLRKLALDSVEARP